MAPNLTGQASAAAASGMQNVLALTDRPGPGRGKGGKAGKDGKNGKGQAGKNNKGGKQGKGQPSNSGCNICGSSDHWAASCPMVQADQGAGAGAEPLRSKRKEKQAAKAAARAAAAAKAGGQPGGRPKKRPRREAQHW